MDAYAPPQLCPSGVGPPLLTQAGRRPRLGLSAAGPRGRVAIVLLQLEGGRRSWRGGGVVRTCVWPDRVRFALLSDIENGSLRYTQPADS